ncbi:hypothetical protein I4U23_005134 [Adineta vaga]|nr:hypothetical protein I4U23_005134 [Adineta vaga]
MHNFTIFLCTITCIGYVSMIVKATDTTSIRPKGRKEGYDALVSSCGEFGCLFSKCCQGNVKVMSCIATQNPGPSTCCSKGTCGQPN